MKDVVVVSATMTPIGDFGGSLKDVSAVALAMRVIESSLDRVGLEKKIVEQVVLDKVGLSLKDIQLIEINEAFAAQYLFR